MKLYKFFEFKKSDLDPIKSFHIKDELNPKVWENDKIIDEIRESLIKIGEDFFTSTDIKCDIKDICLCGSLSNYNWSDEYSDFDLHIIINYSDVNSDVDIVEKLCDYAKKEWNMTHDIKMKGFDVEVAIQDKKDLKTGIESGRMGGVFSLLKNKWVKKPIKAEISIDNKSISSKAKALMILVDELEIQISKSKNYDTISKKIDDVWKKVKTYRKSGLLEGSEYSVGNLIFKLLRRNGYIERIIKLKKQSYDKQFK